jgi:hypothetical protein
VLRRIGFAGDHVIELGQHITNIDGLQGPPAAFFVAGGGVVDFKIRGIGDDEVESGRHTWLSPRGLPEALPKPDKPLSWHPAISRHNPLSRVMGFSVSFWRPSATRPRSIPSMTAEALRPATALPVALGGRDSTGYYGLSAPVPTLVISRPILTEAGYWFRRCSCRKFCAAVGALLTPSPGVPGLELAPWDVRPMGLPLSRSFVSGCGVKEPRHISLGLRHFW